jgi:predicted ATPase
VPIRNCVVIAVEGTHSSGKTTLVHALVSHYRERGVHITCVDEPARTSPFMEDIVLHGQGDFDVIAELDTFAQQLTTQLRAARHHSALIADKTLLNVVAYARLLLGKQDAPVVDAMLQLCAATTTLYDAVLYTSDTFNPHQPDDALRAKVAGQQHEIDHALRDLAAHVGLALVDLPYGCTTAERVRWASARLAEMGLLPR